MSSYGGTGADARGLPTMEERDPAFQRAPQEGDGPNMTAVLDAFRRTMTDNQPFVDQCRLNYETRFAIWNGQSSDGKKHSRESNGKNEPTPWDGASDLRVYLTDTAINYKIARNGLALHKATMTAIPVNGNDVERAETVGNFVKWMVNTQIPHIDREQELLSNYLLEKGVAVTGQFWEVKQEKTLITIRLSDIDSKYPQIRVFEAIKEKRFEDKLLMVFEEQYGVSAKKARAMLKDLRRDGECSAPVLGKEINRPIIRAFCLDRDIFIPPWANDMESAPYIFRVEYFTAEQLRAFVRTEDWDSEWVEAAILRCRGQMITTIPDSTLQPISRSFVYIDRKIPYTDLIGVVFAYQRLSDEDGVPGIYLTIFNPHLPEGPAQRGYAKFGLLGYQHGEYPFVLHRREYLSRKLHDSRGIPEPGKSWQDQIKAHRDSRIDAASLAILPPLMYPLGRPPTRWGPGARVPERRPNEYHHADKPQGDINTENSENILNTTWKEYVGIPVPNEDNTQSLGQDQYEVNKFLEGWQAAYKQCWKLWQQYGDEKTFFRIIGVQKAPMAIMQKGSPTEEYDFDLKFDVMSMNPEQMLAKIENMVKFAQSTDRMGQVDYSQFLQVGLEMMDASIAERVILPKQTGQQQTEQQIDSDLAQIYAGIPHNMKPGMPPQMVITLVQRYLQQPDIGQKYQTDQMFKQRIDQYAKQAKFAITQQQNAVIGRIGTAPAGTPPAAVPGAPQTAQ